MMNESYLQDLVTRKKYAQAIKIIESLDNSQLSNPDLLEIYMHCLIKTKKYKRILYQWEKLSIIQPTLKVIEIVVYSYMKLDNPEKTFEVINNNLQITQTSAKIDEYLILYYLRHNHFQEVEYLINQYKNKIQNSKADYYYGWSEYQKKNYKGAEIYFKRAVAAEKNIYNYSALITNHLCKHKTIFSTFNILVLLSTVFVPFPLNYLFITIYYIKNLLDLFLGIVYRSRSQILLSIFLIATYPFCLIFIRGIGK